MFKKDDDMNTNMGIGLENVAVNLTPVVRASLSIV